MKKFTVKERHYYLDLFNDLHKQELGNYLEELLFKAKAYTKLKPIVKKIEYLQEIIYD